MPASDPMPTHIRKAGAYRRDMPLEFRSDGDNAIELSFSSEAPVMRWGEPEILVHDPGAANFARLVEVGAVLRNHDPDQIVGKPTKVWNDAQAAKGKARMEFGSTDIAQQAKREAVIDQTLRGVSVGYHVHEWVHLADEKTTWGRFSGPAWLATRWDALEISLTPVPADPSVGVGRSEAMRDTRKEEDMDGTPKAETPAADARTQAAPEITQTEQPKVDTQAEITRAIEAERSRIAEIGAMGARHGVDVAMLIQTGASVAEARKAVLDKLADRKPVIEVTRDGVTSFRDAASASMLMRAGRQLDEATRKVAAPDLACMSLVRLAEECLRRRGVPVPHDHGELIRLSLSGPAITPYQLRHGETISSSTSDFPYILANAANKEMLRGASLAPVTYPQWCKIGTSADFKTFSRLKLSESGKLANVPETGTYGTTAFSEQRETGAVLTYGKAFNLSRQMIINDDLQAFTDIPFALGRAAAICPNDLAVQLILANGNMADGVPLFHATHTNLSGSASYKLDTLAHAKDGIAHLIQLLYQMVALQHATPGAGENMYLRVQPKTLLIPPTGMMYAMEAITASGFFGASSVLSGVDYNWIKTFAITPAVEPSLEDSNFSGYSTIAYYIFGDPAVAPVIEVTFLNGVTTPYLEEVENTGTAADGRVFKVRLDCTATKVDYHGAVKEASA